MGQDTGHRGVGAGGAGKPRFDFTETGYYDATMGTGLKKVFFVFQWPFDPAGLVKIKLETNRWEEGIRRRGRKRGKERDIPFSRAEAAESRPRLPDAGQAGLASTKDFAHRIYISRGIYAEITLQYKHHRWQHHEYTFPDYRLADYQDFFSRCREVAKGIQGAGFRGQR